MVIRGGPAEVGGAFGMDAIRSGPRPERFFGPVKCEAHRAKLGGGGDSTLRGILSEIDPNNWHGQGLPQVVNTFAKHIFGMRGDSFCQGQGGGTLDPESLKKNAGEREFWKFLSKHLKSKNIDSNTIHVGGEQISVGQFIAQLDSTIAHAELDAATPAYDRVATFTDGYEPSTAKGGQGPSEAFDLRGFVSGIGKRKTDLQAVVGRNIETQPGGASGHVRYDRGAAVRALRQARADAQRANDVESNAGNVLGNLWRRLSGSRAGDALHSEVARLMEQYGVGEDELAD